MSSKKTENKAVTFFDRDTALDAVKNLVASNAARKELLTNAMIQTIGHGLLHGNCGPMNDLYNAFPDDRIGKAYKADFNAAIRALNEVPVEVQSEGPVTLEMADSETVNLAKVFGRKKDTGYYVNTGRLAERAYFVGTVENPRAVDPATYEETVEAIRQAITPIKIEEEQEDKPPVKSAEYALKRLQKFRKDIGGKYTESDKFAADLYKELGKLIERAENVLK